MAMESPILYTTWVIAGSKPINIIIGTNTGAKIAHFADADPMNIFTIQNKRIRPINSGIPVNPTLLNSSAPLMASTVPNLDTEKKLVKMEMKKHINK